MILSRNFLRGIVGLTSMFCPPLSAHQPSNPEALVHHLQEVMNYLPLSTRQCIPTLQKTSIPSEGPLPEQGESPVKAVDLTGMVTTVIDPRVGALIRSASPAFQKAWADGPKEVIEIYSKASIPLLEEFVKAPIEVVILLMRVSSEMAKALIEASPENLRELAQSSPMEAFEALEWAHPSFVKAILTKAPLFIQKGGMEVLAFNTYLINWVDADSLEGASKESQVIESEAVSHALVERASPAIREVWQKGQVDVMKIYQQASPEWVEIFLQATPEVALLLTKVPQATAGVLVNLPLKSFEALIQSAPIETFEAFAWTHPKVIKAASRAPQFLQKLGHQVMAMTTWMIKGLESDNNPSLTNDKN